MVTPLPPQFPSPDGCLTRGDGRRVRPAHHFAAHVGQSGLGRADSPLLQSLYEQGRLRRVDSQRLDGIQVDSHGHPVGASGASDDTLWIFGPAVEGATFYNHYVGTPDPACRLFVEAQSEVTRCLDRLAPLAASVPGPPLRQGAAAS